MTIVWYDFLMDFKPYMLNDSNSFMKWLRQHQPYKCAICGLSEWNGEFLRLHIDHINGSRSNNELDNLRFLCPNCHSQTETFCGKNTGNERKPFPSDDEVVEAFKYLAEQNRLPTCNGVLALLGKSSYAPWYRDMLDRACGRLELRLATREEYAAHEANKTRREYPELDELRQMLVESSFEAVARRVGVSSTAIRKHLRRNGIDPGAIRNANK